MGDSIASWHTRDEINFIQNLEPQDLVKYSQAIGLRDDWGNINKGKLMKAIQAQLEYFIEVGLVD
jgi:hypothetical protein